MVHRAGSVHKMTESGGDEAKIDPNAARKTKVRGGHRAHLKKLFTNIEASLRGFDPTKEAELLAARDNLKNSLIGAFG